MRTITMLGLVFVAGAAAAQPPGGFTPPTFDGIDKDKNGSLSQAEVGEWVATIPGGQANAADVFGRWDANKDGSVSRAEFDARPRPQAPGGGGGPPPGGQAPG